MAFAGSMRGEQNFLATEMVAAYKTFSLNAHKKDGLQEWTGEVFMPNAGEDTQLHQPPSLIPKKPKKPCSVSDCAAKKYAARLDYCPQQKTERMKSRFWGECSRRLLLRRPFVSQFVRSVLFKWFCSHISHKFSFASKFVCPYSPRDPDAHYLGNRTNQVNILQGKIDSVSGSLPSHASDALMPAYGITIIHCLSLRTWIWLRIAHMLFTILRSII